MKRGEEVCLGEEGRGEKNSTALPRAWQELMEITAGQREGHCLQVHRNSAGVLLGGVLAPTGLIEK